MTGKGVTYEDVKNRIGKARHAFNISKTLWNSSSFSTRNKIRIFNTNVKSVLLYGSETCRATKTITRMLQTFINKCLIYILKTKWQDKTTNKEIWRRRRTDQHSIRREIARRKWTWIGHILRKQTNNVTRQALDWNPQGKKEKQTDPKLQNYLEEINSRGSKETWNHLERNKESSK